MKNILVPSDFSKPAVNATKFAFEIARKSKAVVHILNVIELPIMHDTMLMPTLNFEEQLITDLKKRAEIEFSKLDKKYDTRGVKVVTKIEYGSTSGSIADYIRKSKIDLVIAGSHGASGAQEYFIGSNAEKIIRHSAAPVIVLKENFRGKIEDVVVPVMLDEPINEKLIRKIQDLQSFFKAKMHIVWINTPVHFLTTKESEEKLKELVKKHQLKNCTTTVYNHINPEKGISEFTQSIKADMIALGTHGRKGVSHWLMGSLAESLANHSKTLVWSYVIPDGK